ncbi:MAG: NAD(P)H-binding protein [Catenulispora sp.]|nr:NAD(P)H-binding protein [Catenulispora sp.]
MLLITGATGNTGRELVHELDVRQADFRVLVRDPARAAALPSRAHRVIADLEEPTTLRAAFDGVEKLFLLTQGTGMAQAENAIAAARNAGVKHIVHLSSFHAGFDPVPAMGRWHRDREDAIRASGIPATFLRCGGFMTNALDWARSIREDGYVFDATGPGKVAPIAAADIAAVAARALTEDGHTDQIYTLTGSQAFTTAEMVDILAAALGRDIRVRTAATPEEAVKARFPQGAPPALATALIETVQVARADTIGFRTDTVARLLGREPMTFRQWCDQNTVAFT